MVGKKGQKCGYCGKAAFFWKRELKDGETIGAKDAYVLPGKREPKDISPIECQFCEKTQLRGMSNSPMMRTEFDEDGNEI